MAIQGNQGGNTANPQSGGRSGNTDKKGNKNMVNQGISNAGPTGNRNDRADTEKSNKLERGNTDKPKSGNKTGDRSGSKSNPEKKD